MSRFIIVSLPVEARRLPGRFDSLADWESEPVDAGCAWLFSAGAEVEDAEEALRRAVTEFFGSEDGQAVAEGESAARLGWCEAIPWIPDEVWERHGLTVFRHPDVERILLDAEEDFAGRTATTSHE